MPYLDDSLDASLDASLDDPLPLCDAVILCAGEASRFRAAGKNNNKNTTTKVLVDLGGKPALQHLCETVKKAGCLARTENPRIAVVLPKDQREAEAIAEIASASLPDPILLEGGERRQDSLQKALEALTQDNNDNNNDKNWVMVFDAARPLVPVALVERVAERVARLCQRSVSACVVPLLAVADSVKQLDAKGRVCGTISRTTLGFAQTPQAAPRALLLRLLRETSLTVSDEAQLFQEANTLVEAVEGDALAHKITTRADVGVLQGLLEKLVRSRGETRASEYRSAEYRSATGFDIHKACEGVSFRLCGVDVAAGFSLEGHSDADAGLHAISDAVLSLAGAGDIGDLFPPTDERWRDADSSLFLTRAMALLGEAGGALVSVDATLLLEKPHLGGYKMRMRERLAEIVGLAVERVGVKATTLEGLGALGRREGVACLATVSARFG